MASDFPTQARVVIIGGGIVGCSIAYHLAKLGWRDVRAAGAGAADLRHDLARRRAGRPVARHSNLTRLIRYRDRTLCLARSRDRPRDRLEAMRLDLSVARTPERMTQLRRTALRGPRAGRGGASC